MTPSPPADTNVPPPIGDDKPELVSSQRDYVWPDTGTHYPRVSTILSQAAKPALIPWAAKQTATAAVEQLDTWQALPPDEAIKWLAAARYRTSDAATTRGSAVHAWIPDLTTSTDIPADVTAYLEWLPPETDGYPQIVAACHWLREHCSRVLHQEVTCFRDTGDEQWAGTIDLICETKQWGLAYCDWKSGKGLYPETQLQLAAYALADWLAIPNTRDGTHEMLLAPYEIHHLVGVHLQQTQATSYVWAWPSQAAMAALQGCNALYRWTRAEPWYAAKPTTKVPRN